MGDWLTKTQRSRNMAAIRSSGTKPERILGELVRATLPRRRVIERAALPGKPDYYLPGLKLAVFADGCFWHGCARHGRLPEDNRDYWGPKIERNRARDRATRRLLRREGIRVIRVWEHDLHTTPGRVATRLRRAASWSAVPGG